MHMVWALIRRDLVLSYRQGGGVGTALGFFLVVVTLLPLGLGPDNALLSRIAPGAIWIALLLSVLLSVDRVFQPDHEDGSLEQMLIAPMSLELVVICKTLAHWLTTGVPLALLAPLFGLLLNLDPKAALPLVLSALLGSPALSFLGSLGAALTLDIRRGGLLVSLLILPLYVPVLIFGVSASSGATLAPDLFAPSLLVLLALSLAALVLCPLAAAAAIRSHYR
jgi:heme exporter protein B